MILSASRRNRTCKFTYADEDGKVAKPDDSEAVDETSWPATVVVRYQEECRSSPDSLLEANGEDAGQC